MHTHNSPNPLTRRRVSPTLAVSPVGDQCAHRGGDHATSIAGCQRLQLVTGEESDMEAIGRGRRSAHSTQAIDAVSEVFRAVSHLFGQDGLIDEHEFAALATIRRASGLIHRTDWDRRAGQSYANEGRVNDRLIRELAIIERDFPLDDDAA